MRPRRPIDQPSVAFGKEPVPPLAHRLGINLESFRRRRDRPTTIHDTTNHPTSTLNRKRRVRML
jgi:hypothetical protein